MLCAFSFLCHVVKHLHVTIGFFLFFLLDFFFFFFPFLMQVGKGSWTTLMLVEIGVSCFFLFFQNDLSKLINFLVIICWCGFMHTINVCSLSSLFVVCGYYASNQCFPLATPCHHCFLCKHEALSSSSEVSIFC